MGQNESVVKEAVDQTLNGNHVQKIVGESNSAQPAKSLTTSVDYHVVINLLIYVITTGGLVGVIESAIFEEAEQIAVDVLKTELARLAHGEKLEDVHYIIFQHLSKELRDFYNDYEKAKEEYAEHKIWTVGYYEEILISAYSNLGGLMFGAALGLERWSGDAGMLNHLLKWIGIDLDGFLQGNALDGWLGEKLAAETVGLEDVVVIDSKNETGNAIKEVDVED